MSEHDPHVHLDSKAIQSRANVRNMLAGTFGLAADAPRVVTTGCGRQVPYAMTSERPESVTCLPCREYGRQRHLAFAETLEHRVHLEDGALRTGGRWAQHHRDLARRFDSTP
ncbi:hypothetical protein SAMN05421678_111177 [Actinopolymorpha cephalotaxi]|uniref:Uncharacterized protein n=1 Tax=Actinopolymorpha cephalotaxi TaxID=504797 RepID=A0A1I2WZ31_9ACTN|nr:hypothetical protein [Actinopolymorpha cephalotaxi]NYH85206.1 hypothetical protein [Actinopolymorpha cephalotaxi]SFH06442.1 hypothetical protein SAMN05421678_111177 [Actinopolymorpha cephalotaxi]